MMMILTSVKEMLQSDYCINIQYGVVSLLVTFWGQGKVRVASCKLRVASCKLRVASCELQVASCKLRVANCWIQNLKTYITTFRWIQSLKIYITTFCCESIYKIN